MPGEHLSAVDPAMFDFESWEQNMLAATNWLDVTYNQDYSSFAYTPLPFGEPSVPGLQQAEQTLGNPSFVGRTCTQAQVFPNPVHSDSPASVVSLQSTVLTGSQISETRNDTQEVGQYYVDGEPARLPRVKRRKTSTSTSQPTPLFRSCSVAAFSLNSCAATVTSSSEFTISPEAYSEIQDAYQRFCVNPPAPWTAFETAECPTLGLLESLGDLYVEHFDQVLPFIHQRNSSAFTRHGVLIVAIAAIGAQYVGETLPLNFSTSMHEFVRRWLAFLRESPQMDNQCTQSVLPAQLLSLVGMSYSGDKRLRSAALENRHWLPRISAEASKRVVSTMISAQNDMDEQSGWLRWCELESTVRLAHSAWLIDAMLSYHFDYQPQLALEDSTLPLPSAEKMWLASNTQEWKDSSHNPDPPPSLNEALRIIYIEKRLAWDTGEFARVLIVHGLFQRQKEVEAYLRNSTLR